MVAARSLTLDRRRHTGGFTLIEMLVVLAVLGMVLAVTLLHGRSRNPALEASSAAGIVAAVLRAARAQAIAEDRPVRVSVDPAQHSLRVNGRPPRTLRPEIAAVPPTGIAFAPDGSASGGAVLVAEGAHRLAVQVDWLTGRVSVAEAPPP